MDFICECGWKIINADENYVVTCRCGKPMKPLIEKKDDGSKVPCSGELSAHDLKRLLIGLINKVNAVTCPHRHGNKVTDRVLKELSNRQIEVEKALREMGI